MSRRRPIRAWIGKARDIDPAELVGPRGLTEEVLAGDGDDAPCCAPSLTEMHEGARMLEPAAHLLDGAATASARSSSTRRETDAQPTTGGSIADAAGPARETAAVLPESGVAGPHLGASRADSRGAGARRHGRARSEADVRREAAFFEPLLTDKRRERIAQVVAARLQSVTVVLDRLVDPHNTAAILRTSEGLGLLCAHVVPHRDGDVVAHRRVTQDADKWIDVEAHESGAACARVLAARGFAVYAGHLDDGAVLYNELPADRPVALLFGNEHEGPGAETLAACAGTFRIPMAGFTQSFNVSVAAAIALSWQTRARREALGAAGDLAPEAARALKDRFVLLAAKLARRVKRVP